jgi:uncharacterized membrane protein
MGTAAAIANGGVFLIWAPIETAGAFTRRRNVERRGAADKDRGTKPFMILFPWAGPIAAGCFADPARKPAREGTLRRRNPSPRPRSWAGSSSAAGPVS